MGNMHEQSRGVAAESASGVSVPFNRPYLTGNELEYIAEALSTGGLASDGVFSRRCGRWLQETIGCRSASLTHSCTAALELAAILAGLRAGDEVIMPSYTFSSTANAVVLRGAVPVFVDIRPDTLNIDEALVESAITSRTRAIVVVHYAGVACEMDAILEIARRRELLVIEDAAQAILSAYKGRPLGSIGDLGALSFHETKNVTCGEGGALLVNDPRLVARAEVLRQKGTDRAQFDRGEVDKYRWVDLGSSYAPAEPVAAFLWAQLEHAREIVERRRELWQSYFDGLERYESAELVRRPRIPAHCDHNGHIFHLLLPTAERRTRFIAGLRRRGIAAVFHYVPLADAPAGQRFGRVHGPLDVTVSLSRRLVRMPLWLGIEKHLPRVIEEVGAALSY